MYVNLEMVHIGPGILVKIKPEWYDKDLTTTHFENNKFKSKKGDFKLKDGVKLK